MPPVQNTPPAPAAPVMPPPAPVQAAPVISPIQVPPPPPPPPMDMKPPAPPTPAPHEHPHVMAIAIGALIVGLLLGAAAGYYGGMFQTSLTPANAENTQAMEQMTQEQADADATAETYTDVETNPLQDVQTNPFE